MTLDLILLGAIALFALFGAFSGAAKQVATWVAGLAAWAGAGPLGRALGVPLGQRLGTSHTVGTVLATLLAFFLAFLVLRLALTWLLRRILAGGDPKNRSVDRSLGFVLGGAKVALVAYVLLCAVAFVEDNITIGGKRLAFSPQDSIFFRFARGWNLLESRQFDGVRELVAVAKKAGDPRQAASLKDNADLQALKKDPRFARALQDKRLQSALQSGDVTSLLQNDQVLALIRDPAVRERLERLAQQ